MEHSSSSQVTHQYAFDICFDSGTPNPKQSLEGAMELTGGEKESGTQSDVYIGIGHDILHHIWSGFNVCLFAYGQTGSGNTQCVLPRHVY